VHPPAFIRTAILAAIAAAAALPSTASGQASLATNLPCYSPGEGIRFTGSGYTPNAAITIGLAGNGRSGHYNATADAAGALSFTGTAPGLDDFGASPPRVQLLASATDQTTLGPAGPLPTTLVAMTEITLSDWDLLILPWETMGPAAGKPKRVVTMRTYGWTSLSGTLYAHYVRRGRLVHTVPLGRLRGPCGDLTRKMRQFPFRPVPAGRYTVQFDVRPRYVDRGPRLGYRAVVVAPEDALP
jgi:hypothetical protein